MEVRQNSGKNIFRSLTGLLPLMLGSLFFYGILLSWVSLWLLSHILDMDDAMAKQFSWTVGGLLLVITAGGYLHWIITSLLSSRLSIIDDTLFIKGKTGFRQFTIEMPVCGMRQITIGGKASRFEKWACHHHTVRDQVASRLNFVPVAGKPFTLDCALQIFDPESLYEFLLLADRKGITTNIRT